MKHPKLPPLAKFEAQIAKTGFVLENRVAETLKKAGWNVISNRYYVDDTGEETVRELDLIAYKATKLPDFRLYTGLLLSCKKSEKNAWTLLSRPINVRDPNANWWPLHAWSNNKALSFELSVPDTPRRYHDAIQAAGVKALTLPAVDVFGYQEMDRNDGTAHNQKAIFQSVTSLIKAQSYELQSMVERQPKEPVIYQLNLLSIIDADLVRLHFEKGDITASAISDEHYITRYIVSKRHTVARVRFIKADYLDSCLPDYASLHEANCKWARERHDAFYKDAVKDDPRVDVFLEQFRKRVGWYLRLKHKNAGKFDTFEDKDLRLDWQPSENALAISVFVSDKLIEAWNNDEATKAHVAQALEQLYRYKGRFFFSSDIPF